MSPELLPKSQVGVTVVTSETEGEILCLGRNYNRFICKEPIIDKQPCILNYLI